MYLLKGAALLLAAGMFFWNGCSPRTEQPMNRAMKAAVEGEWSKADKPSEEAVKLTPDNVNALILRALVCERLGRYDEAVENAYKAAGIDSSSFLPVYTLGRLYAANPNRRNEAINLLLRANRFKSDHAGTLILLCNLHQIGRKASYLAALSRLPGYDRSPELIFESCMDRVYRRNRKGVNDTLIKLFNDNPGNPELTSAIAGYFFCCNERNMRPVARAAYRRYLAFPEKQRTPKRSAVAAKRLPLLK